MSLPSGRPALPIAGGGHPGRRVQYAALPYRVRRDGEVQIRLITSRETRRWVIPKGWPIKGLTPPKTAARESYEEAGLMGAVAREPIGMYTYEKRLGTRTVLCDVLVFPLKVKRLLQKWPERYQRYGFWFSIDSAAGAVQEEELSELIRAFGDLMARKREAKLRAAQEKAGQEKAGQEKAGQEKAAREKAGKARPEKAGEARPAEEAGAAAPVAAAAPGKKPACSEPAGKALSGKALSGKAVKEAPAAEAAPPAGERPQRKTAAPAAAPEAPAEAAAASPASAGKKARGGKAEAAKPKRKDAAASKDPPSGEA